MVVTEAKRREVLVVYDRGTARLKWEYYKIGFATINILALISGIFYLPLVLIGIYLGILSYILTIYREFFSNKLKRDLYEYQLRPVADAVHYFAIGTEIYEKEIVRKLKEVEEKKYYQGIEAKKHPEKIVGLSRNQLTTHFWILGTTGAGKTSLLMTIFQRHMKLGGGLIFIDGKSDTKMFKKLYSIAVENGREHDIFLINYLKPERKTDSNTMNIILNLPAPAAVEFLASLLGEASGDASYWQGRGIVYLRPIVFFLGMRKEFWNENYSYATVRTYLARKDFAFMGIVLYALMKSMELKLRMDASIEPFIKDAKGIATPNTQFEYVELLRTYMIQKPQEKEKISMLGYSVRYIDQLFQTYSLTMQYISGIYNDWKIATEYLGESFYDYLEQNGDDVDSLSIHRLRLIFNNNYNEIIEPLSDEAKKIIQSGYEDPPPNAIQQLQYSSQIWEDMMSSFEVFSHILGSLDPDVNFEDIIKNNRILYILLPPLEQSKNTVEVLGRMIVSAVRQATSIALGDNVEYSITQDAIIKDSITPKPVFLVVADEYGAYPVGGIDTILAQVRSINISFLLSTQDYASARAGDKETAVERAWANTQKIILRIKDNTTKAKLSEALGEVKFQTFRKMDFGYEVAEDVDMQIETEKLIDPKVIDSMKDGVGIIITDGLRPVYFHSFWADPPESEEVRLTRLESI